MFGLCCTVILACVALHQVKSQAASGDVAVTGTSGAITSPNYPSDYSNSIDVVTMITGPPGTIILFEVCTMQIEGSGFTYIRNGPGNCPWDWIQVMSPLVTNIGVRICGDDAAGLPGLLESLNNRMDIRFRSDSVFFGMGFDARWVAVPAGNPPDAGTCVPACQNNGTCTGGLCNSICLCPPGVSGNNCEFIDNPCLSQFPCLNGGVCRSDGLCSCPAGFFGSRCETNPCCSNPCTYGEICYPVNPNHCNNERQYICLSAGPSEHMTGVSSNSYGYPSGPSYSSGKNSKYPSYPSYNFNSYH